MIRSLGGFSVVGHSHVALNFADMTKLALFPNSIVHVLDYPGIIPDSPVLVRLYPNARLITFTETQ